MTKLPAAPLGGAPTAPPLERAPVLIGGYPDHGGYTLPLAAAQLDALELGVSQLHEGVSALLAAAVSSGDRVDDRQTLTLSATPGSAETFRGNPVDLFWSAAHGPLQSWALANSNPFPVYVGAGPGGGSLLAGAWTVPPFTLLVAGGNADTLSVGADAASVAGADATVTVWRSSAPVDHPAAYPLGAPLAVPLAQTLTPPVGAGGTFTGPGVVALPWYVRARGGVYADQAATVNLQAQATPGAAWRTVAGSAIPGGGGYSTLDYAAFGAAMRLQVIAGAAPLGALEAGVYLLRA